MKHQRHFDASYATSREAVQISRMISDLERLVQLLDCNIAVQEECVGISDQSDVAYPILASSLAARRDNLRETIAALEQRLSKLDQPERVA
jgi:hypothetical protein